MKTVIRAYLADHVGSDLLEGDMVRMAHRKLNAQAAEIKALREALAYLKNYHGAMESADIDKHIEKALEAGR